MIIFTTIDPHSPNPTPSPLSNQSQTMASVPPDDPQEESSAMAELTSNSLKAEHEAAVTAYNGHVKLISLTRDKYDALIIQQKHTQVRCGKIMEREASYRTIYQRHKRHFTYLSNSLLASNATLRSAPMPLSDIQALTHATLYHEFRHAFDTLAPMIYQYKRLEKARNTFWELEQTMFAKCEQVFAMLERDCRVMDRLHAKVLDLEKKMGRNSSCQVADGNCVSCARTKEREARAAAAVEQAAREKKGGDGKVSVKNAGKGVGAKGRSEDTVGKAMLGDKAGK